MPELPEVEIISRQLDKTIKRQTIVKIEVLHKKSLRGRTSQVEGEKVVKVERKAKMIRVRLTNKKNLIIHLKMTGQLVYASKFEARSMKFETKYTRVIFELDKGRLLFNDLRIFGWVKIITDNQWEAMMVKLPPDVVDKQFTVMHLKKALADSRRAVKLIVLDQSKLGGVGNIYANESLYWAEINPKIAGSVLAQDQARVRQLWRGLKRVIGMGIRYGGATAKDKGYINLEGLRGKYQEHFLVYERAGESCRKCGGKIKKIKLGGRGTYYCPKCQK